jgi:ABC-type multidrug transport system ATPase subunit/pSer/pThr/pTyr-binding forkhead associated (FHA) protein
LTEVLVTIGRETGNSIIICHPAVSRHHAQIEQRGGDYWISDLGSTNGTSVNGRSIQAGQARKLDDRDIIRIGDRHGNSIGLTFCATPIALQPTGTIHLGKLSLANLPSYRIGRDPANQVHLDHPTVSRFHSRVDQTGTGHVIHDLNSANGTFVNGKLVRNAARPLQPGDVIQIGPFKLVYDPTGLTQYAPAGNYRLDGINLRREVTIDSGLSLGDALKAKPKPIRKLILDEVSVSIYPREFVALVGGSGAGKTTLLNALCGFVPASGRVLINGDDLYANFAAYRSALGYVPQDDIVHTQLTAAGVLTYAARLRLPDATPQEIAQRVTQAMALVDMTAHADKPIHRLSGGQRKRVSIAVELLADPGLFFLDEPTSGLDPGLEKKMMYTMRQLADAGRTIVLVTHATANITQCTNVAFMADGKLVYFGPPQEALAFFRQTDFADIYTSLAQPVNQHRPPPGWHPPAPGQPQPATSAQAWAAAFRSSPQYQQYVAARLQSVSVGSSQTAAAKPARQKVSLLQQLVVLTQRYLDVIRHDALSLFMLLLVMPIIGLLLLMMAKPHDLVGKSPSVVQYEIQQQIGVQRSQQDRAKRDEQFQASYGIAGAAQKLLFMLALAACLLGTFAAAYEIVKEAPIYRRERMVNLEIMPYVTSKLTVLGGFVLIQCFLLLGIVRLRVQYPAQGVLLWAPLEMYVTLFLAAMAGISLGLFVSAFMRSSSAVIYVILMILFVQIIFAGAIFDLPAATRPISYLTTTRWTLEALGGTVDMQQLRADEATCIEFEDERMRGMLGNPETPCEKGQMKQALSYKFNVDYRHTVWHLLSRWLVLGAFSVVFVALTCIVQRRKDVL